jgi:hypothetical protein
VEKELQETTLSLKSLKMTLRMDKKKLRDYEIQLSKDIKTKDLELEHYRSRLTQASVELEEKASLVDQLRVELARQLEEKQDVHHRIAKSNFYFILSVDFKINGFDTTGDLEWDKKLQEALKDKTKQNSEILKAITLERDELLNKLQVCFIFNACLL